MNNTDFVTFRTMIALFFWIGGAFFMMVAVIRKWGNNTIMQIPANEISRFLLYLSIFIVALSKLQCG